jgi:hypothetical protein
MGGHDLAHGIAAFSGSLAGAGSLGEVTQVCQACATTSEGQYHLHSKISHF